MEPHVRQPSQIVAPFVLRAIRLVASTAAILLVAEAATFCRGAVNRSSPNVIVVHTDDQNNDAVGCYWSPRNPNNNINGDWGDSPLLKPGKTGFCNAFHVAAAVEKILRYCGLWQKWHEVKRQCSSLEFTL